MPNLSEILIYTGEIPLELIIWSLFVGITLAIIASFIIKVKFGAFVNKLLALEANSPESAVTLGESGLSSSFFVKIGLHSRANYKNLLVAVTDDGKYYANEYLTEIIPSFKDFSYSRRAKKSKIVESNAQKEGSAETELEESALSKRLRAEQEKAESLKSNVSETEGISDKIDFEKYLELTNKMPKERVKFNIKTAKYYIPKKLHDRASSLYISTPTMIFQLILGILALAVVAIAAIPVINMLLDFITGLSA